MTEERSVSEISFSVNADLTSASLYEKATADKSALCRIARIPPANRDLRSKANFRPESALLSVAAKRSQHVDLKAHALYLREL